ncbi:propionate--CoA ligase [Malassezia sp. CBS 17886]|nr:propionate--CoA ligase [Malassezia sp. CBS 17886]
MQAVQLEKPPNGAKKGERHIVAVRTVPLPAVREDMVLVRILAAGMNRRDEWAALGLYPGLVFKDSTLGCDGCGVIVDPATLQPTDNTQYLLTPTRGWAADPAGAEAQLPGTPASVRRSEFGGQGFGLLGASRQVCGVGTFADYIAVDRTQLVRAPKHLTAEQSAALPCAGVTAYRALFTRGAVTRGQNVLITGIGGGVALLAMQLALAAGASVFVTGGSPQKVDRAVQMGARGGALYSDEKWPEHIRAQLPGDRAWLDTALDSAGGEIAEQSLRAGMRDGGRVVVVGMTSMVQTSFTMREVLRNVNLLGSSVGSAREFAEFVAFVDEHRIVPVVDKVLPGLDHAEEGLALLGDTKNRSGGKIVINVGSIDVPMAKA